MTAICVLFALSAYPTFVWLVSYPSLTTIVLIVGWMSLLKAGYSSVLPSLMAEIFPTQTRASGLSLSYNIAVPLFGGAAPLYITALIDVTGSNLVPSYYLIATALLSLAVLTVIRSRLGLR
jgi:MFS transporter, MHS family, proline/betaine transporter